MNRHQPAVVENRRSTSRALLLTALPILASGGFVACASMLGIESDPYVTADAAPPSTGSPDTSTPGTTTPDVATTPDVVADTRPSETSAPPDVVSDAPPAQVKCQGTLRVRIGTDLFGATSDVGTPFYFGLYDSLRELNAKGGIRGCMIDIQACETSYRTADMIACYNLWKADTTWPEVSTLFTHGTGPTFAIADQSTADKKIVSSTSYAGAYTSPAAITTTVSYAEVNSSFASAQTSANKSTPGYPYFFFPGTDYSTGARIGVYAAWKQGGKRVGLFYDNNSSYCTAPLAAIKNYIPKLPGLSLGRDNPSIPQTPTPVQAEFDQKVTDYFQAEIDHMHAERAAGRSYDPVDWIWSGNTVFATVAITKAVAAVQTNLINALSSSERWTVRVMVNNWGIGEQSDPACGAPCHDILHGIFPFKTYADIAAIGMNDVMNQHDKYHPSGTTEAFDFAGAIVYPDGGASVPAKGTPLRFQPPYRDTRYVQGFVTALMWKTAVERSLDAGNPVVTSDTLKAAYETFSSVDMRQLTSGPISFTPTDHRPQANEVIYKVGKGGQLEYVDNYSITADPAWIGW